MAARSTSASPVLIGLLDGLAQVFLLVLPLLRPLIWSGEPTTLPNGFYAVLVAGATATGLMLRACTPATAEVPPRTAPTRWRDRLLPLAAAGLAVALLVSAWRSPLPARAWTLIAWWALQLAAAWALAPVIARRGRLLLIGLLAGLVLECLLMAAQVAWIRPALQAAFASDPDVVMASERAAYLDRITLWRLEGTFLLANTLAAYLITVLPLAVLAARAAWVQALPWAGAAGGARARAGLLTAIAAGGALALVMTGSKAGIIAALLAAAVTAAWTWWHRLSRTRRLLLLASPLVLVAIACLVPPVRHHLQASSDVRLDYWRGALRLADAQPLLGQGLEGFHVLFPRVKPIGAEPTIYAHQETLQLACDAGYPAALLSLIVIGLVMATSARRIGASRLRSGAPGRLAASPEPVLGRQPTGPDAAVSWPVVAGAAALLSLALVGMGIMDGEWQALPGTSPLPWDGALIAISVLLVAALRRLPDPSPRAAWCGVLGCLLHAQADFHLHSQQVVGILVLVGWLAWQADPLAIGAMPALADGPARAGGRPAPASPACGVGTSAQDGRRLLCVAAALAVVAVVLCAMARSADREARLDHGRDVDAALRHLRAVVAAPAGSSAADPAQQRAALALADQMLARDGYPELAPRLSLERQPQIAACGLSCMHDLMAAAAAWPRDEELDACALSIGSHLQVLAPASLDALTPLFADLAAAWPLEVAYAAGLADHTGRLADRAARDPRVPGAVRRALAESAEAWARRTVDMYPTHLPFREQLVSAARRTGDFPTVLAEIGRIRSLQAQVHASDRPYHTW